MATIKERTAKDGTPRYTAEIRLMRKVRKPTLPRRRVRFLDDTERAKLLKVCKESID